MTATVRCYTDQTRSTLGQVNQIGIKIQLFNEATGLLATKDVPSSPPAVDRTVSLTFPDPATNDVALCDNGRYYAEVTGSAVFKSGMPLEDSDTGTTASAFLTCQSRSPLPQIPDPTLPGPDPTPDPNPAPAPAPPPRPPCTRPPCTPPIVGEPPA